MGARMLPLGQSRGKGSFRLMDALGPVLGAIGFFLKTAFAKNIVLPVVIIGVAVGCVAGICLCRKEKVISSFSTKPRILHQNSVLVEVPDDRYGGHYYTKTECRNIIDCYTENRVSETKLNGKSIVVSEITVFKMGFDFEGNGSYPNECFTVVADQMVFHFDESLSQPYVTFSGLTRWPDEEYFREFYMTDPTAKVTIYCRRSHVPEGLAKATGLPSEEPKQPESR